MERCLLEANRKIRTAVATLRVSLGVRVDAEPRARLGLRAITQMDRGTWGLGATGQRDRGRVWEQCPHTWEEHLTHLSSCELPSASSCFLVHI